VPTALAGHTEHWVSVRSWMDGLEAVEPRLARVCDGWIVIGEYTDVRYLDREMPRERRWQNLGIETRRPGNHRPAHLTPRRIADFEGLRATPIRSVWWHSGWLDSSRWTSHDEVGEGWLVLAPERVLSALEEVLGASLTLAWAVRRDFRSAGQPAADKRTGLRPLVKNA
jgi:hypothetical protein